MLIVGGGLAGACAAWMLAQAGSEVVLIEARGLNTLASGSNAGSLHAQIPHAEYHQLGDGWARGFAPLVSLLIDSLALWRTLGDEIGADLGVRFDGALAVAENDEQMRALEAKTSLERAQGLDIRMIGRDELLALAPYCDPRMVGGTYCSKEGKADPLVATPALARAAAALGAGIVRGVALTGLERCGEGYRATTTAGTIQARRVVNAAGAQAAQVAAMLGLRFGIEGFAIQVSVTEPIAPLIRHLVYHAGGKLSLKQAKTGGVLIGGGWPGRCLPDGRTEVDQASLRANLARAIGVVPALRDVHLLRTWVATVNGTADWNPVLGEVPGMPGFHMLVFPWLGFSAGPGAARLVVDQLLGRKGARGGERFLLAA
ncbi:MAG: FAD-binding oxidoreductase [Alsobacter sp.]